MHVLARGTHGARIRELGVGIARLFYLIIKDQPQEITMLQRFRELKNILAFPSKDFAEKFSTPKTTPDICLLQQQRYHWVFDHNNFIHTPCEFNEVYSDQRFYMWQQNHEEGTPPLVFKDVIIDQRSSSRARLKGKLHKVPTEQLVNLDLQLENRVNYERRQTRLVFPFDSNFWRKKSWEAVEPLMFNAWIYVNSLPLWRPKFEYDFAFWRGRSNTAFTPAKTRLDNRQFIGRYFTPNQGEAHKPKCTFAVFNMRKLKINLQADERDFVNQEKYDQQQQNNGKSTTLPQLS